MSKTPRIVTSTNNDKNYPKNISQQLNQDSSSRLKSNSIKKKQSDHHQQIKLPHLSSNQTKRIFKKPQPQTDILKTSKLSIHSQRKADNFQINQLWINFQRQTSQLGLQTMFIISLKEIIEQNGYFSPQIKRFIKQKLIDRNGFKFRKAFNIYINEILNKILEPILMLAQAELTKNTQELQTFYNLIDQGNKQKIRQFLEQQTDPNHQNFNLCIQKLQQLSKEPNRLQKRKQQQDKKLKLMNKQKQKFIKHLQQKKIELQNTSIQLIMNTKKIYGSFSQQIIKCIQQIPQLIKVKHNKKKVIGIFQQLFRNIQIPQNLINQLKKIGLEDRQIKDIKRHIVNEEDNQIKQILKQCFKQYDSNQEILISQLLFELMKLRPKQIISTKSNSSNVKNQTSFKQSNQVKQTIKFRSKASSKQKNVLNISSSSGFKHNQRDQQQQSYKHHYSHKRKSVKYVKQQGPQDDQLSNLSYMSINSIKTFNPPINNLRPLTSRNKALSMKQTQIHIQPFQLNSHNPYVKQNYIFQNRLTHKQNNIINQGSNNVNKQSLQLNPITTKKSPYVIGKTLDLINQKQASYQRKQRPDNIKEYYHIRNKNKKQFVNVQQLNDENKTNKMVQFLLNKQRIKKQQVQKKQPQIIRIQQYTNLTNNKTQHEYQTNNNPNKVSKQKQTILPPIKIPSQLISNQQKLAFYFQTDQNNQHINNNQFNQIIQQQHIFFQQQEYSRKQSELINNQGGQNNLRFSIESFYVLVVIQNDNNFQIYYQQKNRQMKNITNNLLIQKQNNKLGGLVYKFNFNPNTISYIIKYKTKKAFILKEQKKLQITKQSLEKNQLNIIFLMNQNTYKQQQCYQQLVVFYLFVILSELSRRNNYKHFWLTLQNFRYLFLPKNLSQIRKHFQKLKNIINMHLFNKLNPKCSRLLLYYIITYININKEGKRYKLSLQSSLVQSLSLIANFEQCLTRPIFFQQYYTYQLQIRIIFYCMILQFKQNQTLTNSYKQNFINYFKITFQSLKTFEQKKRLITQIKNCCKQKFQSFDNKVKDNINLNNYKFSDYITLSLCFINSLQDNAYQMHSRNHHYHEDSYLVQIYQRQRILLMIKKVIKFVQNMPAKQIQKLNENLSQNKSYYLYQIKQILFRKNNLSTYFLFEHQDFSDLYQRLFYLKKKNKLDMFSLFDKNINHSAKRKAIQSVLRHKKKYARMVVIMCSCDNQVLQYLAQILNQIPYEGDLLLMVSQWFRNYFNKQNSFLFECVLQKIIKNSKKNIFTAQSLLTTLQKICDDQQKQKKGVDLIIYIFKKNFNNFVNISSHLSSQLKSNLLQIALVRDSFRQIYIKQLTKILNKSSFQLRDLQRVACDVISDNIIKKSDKQYIFNKLFENRKDKKIQQLKKDIVKYWIQGKRQIKILQFYKNFSQALNLLIYDIELNSISYQIIQKMNKSNLKQTLRNNQQYLKLIILIQQGYELMEKYQNKVNSLIKVLQTHQQFQNSSSLFRVQIQYLKQWKNNIKQKPIQFSVKYIKTYVEYLQHSNQFESLMKFELWNKSSIHNMKDLLKESQKTKQKYQKLIKQFEMMKLSYNQFRKYFKKQIIETIFKNTKLDNNNQTKDKNKNNNHIKDKLFNYIIQFDDQTLHLYRKSIISINTLSIFINNKEYFKKSDQQVIQFLINPTSQIYIQQAFQMIEQIDKKFKKLNINLLNPNQQILRIIINKDQCPKVFQMIDQKKLVSTTIKNDLADYITDLQYSFIRSQDIQQLQNVIAFYQKMKKAKNLQTYLPNLKLQIQTNKNKLSQCISNVDEKLQQFKRLIDSATNRQNSLKYDLQQILINSVVSITNFKGIPHLQVVPLSEQFKSTKLYEKKTKNQNNMQQQKKNKKYTFKQLTQFKNKAMLLVTDFQRSNDNQSLNQQTRSLYEKYQQLYKVLNKIQHLTNKAIIYGYNPNNLIKQESIKQYNFYPINQLAQSINQKTQKWIKQVKDNYRQCFLLTHFMGPNLNAFINDMLSNIKQKKFQSQIRQILGLDKNIYNRIVKDMQYIIKQQNKIKIQPIQRVKLICNLFEKQSQSSKKNIPLNQQFKSQLQLITCHKVQNYYFALVKDQSEPKMNQILYCQKQTSIEEIQVFLKRSMIKTSRKHYFIGIHYLSPKVQLMFIDILNQNLRFQGQKSKLLPCRLTFIDDSPIQKVYLHLCNKQLFEAKQITDTHLKTVDERNYILKKIGQTYLVQSRISGLGKTFWAEKLKQNSNIVYFSIAGNVDFQRLIQRLKSKLFIQNRNNTLIIQIGHVQNKNKLEIFLFEIIFFKGFNFKQFFFLPKDITIVIEIQNIYQIEDKYQYYSILNIIKVRQDKLKYKYVENFEIQTFYYDINNIQESFTFCYLYLIHTKDILKIQIPYDQFAQKFFNKSIKLCSQEQAKQLVILFFLDNLKQRKTDPTFWLYKSFMKLLFKAFKTFSLTQFFKVKTIKQIHAGNQTLNISKVRIDFLNCCIRNSIQFLESTIDTNEFNSSDNNNKTDFRNKLSIFPFMIMPAYDFHNYQFIYINQQNVNLSIKSLIISQTIHKYMISNKHNYKKSDLQKALSEKIVLNLFKQKSLQALNKEQLQKQIFRILHQLSGNLYFDNQQINKLKQSSKPQQKLQYDNFIKQIQNYSITLDNFFKMCLILQRAISNIPIIIMGQSGVGKTALLNFLVKIVLKHNFQVFNIHAGVNQQKLIEFYKTILSISSKIQPTKKLWVFFDEFNTTNQLSYIKEMIIDRKFQGQKIPDNVVLIGACNPYRKRQQSKLKQAGIKKKQVLFNDKIQSNLAFRVNPPSLSMIQFMWDYQQLQQKQNLCYISKIIQTLSLQNHENVVKTISRIHQDFKRDYQISAVSLRDVARFKQLYLWFLKNMTKFEKQNYSEQSDEEFQQNQKSQNINNFSLIQQQSNRSKINPNYNIDNKKRAISLSLAFCYSLRISDKQQRKQYLSVMNNQLYGDSQITIEKILQNQQIDYVQKLKIQNQKIAINFSLRQNIFTTLVCLMNKIPILIIGNPGNSKSLSIRMISSNLRGQSSRSQFCRKLPQLNLIYFQGSETCQSRGVQQVFSKAIKKNQIFRKKKIEKPNINNEQSCVLFDQIGLAEKSVHNPLKVLHQKLQINNRNVCFIGISNWELDAAKMSRFLVLSRSNPQIEELKDTAFKILQSYIQKNAYMHRGIFQKMSQWYYEFIKRWDLLNKGTDKQGFFGLRDFYCFIKYVAEQLQKQPNMDDYYIKQKAMKAVRANFDGQQQSIDIFCQISNLDKGNYNQNVIDPIKLVEQNINKDSSRSLLLIVRGDALIPIISNGIKIKGQNKRIECIYGSTFERDRQSQQYNLQVTSKIISHMSRGTILTFKNPNNSIQTSLYDVFNKSFIERNQKKYCRVAVGANTNPQCLMHQQFASIVFIDEQMIKYTDLAFLNRFEKHLLTLGSVLLNEQNQIVRQIKDWLENITQFKKITAYKKQQHYLINSSQQSIVTLVIKYRQKLNNDRQTGIKKIKKSLLKNATEHFHIALINQNQNQQNNTSNNQENKNKNLINTAYKNQINYLFSQIKFQQQQKFYINSTISEGQKNQNSQQKQFIPKDKIIFTYDQGIIIGSEYKFYNKRTTRISISEIKCQKQFQKMVNQAYQNSNIDNIHIIIDFQKQFHHVNFVAYYIMAVKESFKQDKVFYVIIKLSQSSLDNAGRDHINISYLLNFEQLFIDSLTLGYSFTNGVVNKTIKQLYIQRKMQQNFTNFYIQALKRFRYIFNQIDIPKDMISSNIKDFQLDQLLKMHKNQLFKNQALDFILSNISEAKVDLTLILFNSKYKNQCSSPEQSFDKHLQNCVIQTICQFIDLLNENSLLLGFDIKKLLIQYSKYYDVNLLKTIYSNNQNLFDQFFHECLKKIVKKQQNNETTSYKRIYNQGFSSNILRFKNLCLLPMGTKQLQYISSSNIDSLFKNSSKILQLSVSTQQQDVRLSHILMKKCILILNEKSQLMKNNSVNNQSFDFEKYLNENLDLQRFYFFDMITKIYSGNLESIHIDTKILPLSNIVYQFIEIFQIFEMKEKILLLSLSKEIWSNIFNIWSLWIANKQQGFHIQMIKYYKQVISQFVQNKNQPYNRLPALFIELIKATLIYQQTILKFNQQNIKIYGVDKYFIFFRRTYFYIQNIRIFCGEINLQIQSTMKATKRLFDLIERIFKKQQIENQLYRFIQVKQNSFQAKVQQYLSNLLILFQENKKALQNSKLNLNKLIKNNNKYNCLKNSIKQQQNKKFNDHILSYLSLEIYSSWIKKLKQSQKTDNIISPELNKCITSFINYSDRYSLFANNSTFFLQRIFDQFIDLAKTVEQKINYLRGLDNQMTKIIKKSIIMKNNFVVALGNFFMNNIQHGLAQQISNQNEKIIIGKVKQSFIKSNLEIFQNIIKQNNNPNQILQIFLVEFMKYYGLKYLDALDVPQQITTIYKIDELLNLQSENAKTMRLYLLKIILYRQQKMQIVKKNYLDNKKCKWLIHFKDLVCGNPFQALIPPPSLQQSSKILTLISEFKNSQFQKIQTFGQILQESFVSSYTKYQFLTFMMTDIYAMSCPQDRIKIISQIIFASKFYKNNTNKAEFELLKSYINHTVTDSIRYQIKNNQTLQKKNQYFVKNQLVFLNYLNIFIACNKCQCPLIEMFFEKDGNCPNKYKQYLQNRFLINGRQNQSVSFLNAFLSVKLVNQSRGCYRCSTECDYYYIIGNCTNPSVQSKCPWCKNIIGGIGHKLTRLNQGARKIQKKDLRNQRQIIRQKKFIKILNHKLNGFSYSKKTSQMTQQVNRNKRLHQSAKYLFQQMFYSVWSFLSASKILSQQTIRQIFNTDSTKFQNQSYQIMKNFYNIETKFLELNEEDQSNVVWHLAISKQLMKSIVQYSSYMIENPNTTHNLTTCLGRDTYEEYLLNKFLLKYSTGNQKSNLINQQKCIKKGVKISGQQLLRQTGNFEQYLEAYPKIRLTKILHIKKYPCFNNLVNEYKQIINHDNKILSFYITHEHEVENLTKFRTIYLFITKILKLFNMKITRQDAEKKSLMLLYQQLIQTKNQDRQVLRQNINIFKRQVELFCQNWNQVRSLKLHLNFQCENLGQSDQSTIQLQIESNAVSFFPDAKSPKNNNIIPLLQATTLLYNQICHGINDIQISQSKFGNSQLINFIQVNPTQIQSLTKTLQLNRQLIQANFLANYSNWSVQYGYGIPHYAINKVQSLIVQNIQGSHVLNQQKNEYESINFIGEQLSFITQIRQFQGQQQWEQNEQKQKIQKYIIRLKNQNLDSFTKKITQIKGAFQRILRYFELQKGKMLFKKTIKQFINENNIDVGVMEYQVKQLFFNIQIKFILSLYEFIELYTLQRSAQLLDNSYKRQTIDKNQQNKVKLFFIELNKAFTPQQNINYHFSVALYRFAARSLLSFQKKQTDYLNHFLSCGYDLWPKNFNIQRVTNVKGYDDAFYIQLTKMKSLMDFVGFKNKKTKTQALLNDQKDRNQNKKLNKPPQSINNNQHNRLRKRQL